MADLQALHASPQGRALHSRRAKDKSVCYEEKDEDDEDDENDDNDEDEEDKDEEEPVGEDEEKQDDDNKGGAEDEQAPPALSKYELMREANINRNELMMQSLGLAGATSNLSRAAGGTKKARRSRAKKNEDDAYDPKE
jgi:hypothetical protein